MVDALSISAAESSSFAVVRMVLSTFVNTPFPGGRFDVPLEFRVWVKLWAGMLRNNTSDACQTGKLLVREPLDCTCAHSPAPYGVFRSEAISVMCFLRVQV